MATAAPDPAPVPATPAPLLDRAWFNVALPLGAAIVVNGLIYMFGWDGGRGGTGADTSALPPGPVIGLVWLVLIGLLGLSRWLYVVDSGRRDIRSWFPMLVAAMCIAYPFYTDGMSEPGPAITGTLVTLLVTVLVMFVVSPASRRAAWAMLPTAVWLSYVALITLFA